jgi:hypothetical protein
MVHTSCAAGDRRFRSVETRPGSERAIRKVGGGRVSEPPLVAVNEPRPVREMVLGGEEALFQTGVVVDPERVDADLGLEERGGRHVVGERGRERAVTRTVIAHGGDSE